MQEGRKKQTIEILEGSAHNPKDTGTHQGTGTLCPSKGTDTQKKTHRRDPVRLLFSGARRASEGEEVVHEEVPEGHHADGEELGQVEVQPEASV